MLLPHASMRRLMLGKGVPLLSDKVKDSICAWVLVARVSNKMTHALLQKAQKDCSFLDVTFIISEGERKGRINMLMADTIP